MFTATILEAMVETMVRIDDDDHLLPRVSVERPRRSTTLTLSPLLIIDGLSRKNSSYCKLPDEPINLSVLKLDGSSFDVKVTKTATVAELKLAVEAVFSHMPQKGPGKISWPHVWGHFCLCYYGRKLVHENECIRNYGIKDGDQLHFARHISASYTLMKRESKKENIALKEQRMSRSPASIVREDEVKVDMEYYYGEDIENGKFLHYDNEGFTEQRETRLTHLIGRWFPCSGLAAVGKRRIEDLQLNFLLWIFF
ncbi:uncharacterized protein LOC112492137 isoform X2 [Ziziphus jujuba]|uniref:Uncharacterized protein LOC112492137 isoform X2 n=1 Tax=Ziziphus jujuba TaxID=326968 RepID=A0ABM3IL90_ZIZJJ|nr:uncharacterized protein LOC112492137 isoform X2 [Ziziphus jujuba]